VLTSDAVGNATWQTPSGGIDTLAETRQVYIRTAVSNPVSREERRTVCGTANFGHDGLNAWAQIQTADLNASGGGTTRVASCPLDPSLSCLQFNFGGNYFPNKCSSHRDITRSNVADAKCD